MSTLSSATHGFYTLEGTVNDVEPLRSSNKIRCSVRGTIRTAYNGPAYSTTVNGLLSVKAGTSSPLDELYRNNSYRFTMPSRASAFWWNTYIDLDPGSTYIVALGVFIDDGAGILFSAQISGTHKTMSMPSDPSTPSALTVTQDPVTNVITIDGDAEGFTWRSRPARGGSFSQVTTVNTLPYTMPGAPDHYYIFTPFNTNGYWNSWGPQTDFTTFGPGPITMQDGVWFKAEPYVKHGGTWKKADTYVKRSGVWRQIV